MLQKLTFELTVSEYLCILLTLRSKETEMKINKFCDIPCELADIQKLLKNLQQQFGDISHGEG
jgi:hypothetical protein